MARAKRTDRAEARRKYRAYLAAETAAAEQDEEVEPETSAGRWRFPGMPRATSSTDVAADRKASGASPANDELPTGRVGIFTAMRIAYKPIHYREDFAFIPTLATRTHAVWPTLVLVVAGLLIVTSGTSDDFLIQASAMAITPFPIIPPMLAGFFAPRASWLAGAIAGLLSGAAYGGLLIQSLPQAQKLNPALKDVSGAEVAFFVAQAVFFALSFGALFGAASGWYKRWLTLSGARGARPIGQNARRQRSARSSRRKTTRP